MEKNTKWIICLVCDSLLKVLVFSVENLSWESHAWDIPDWKIISYFWVRWMKALLYGLLWVCLQLDKQLHSSLFFSPILLSLPGKPLDSLHATLDVTGERGFRFIRVSKGKSDGERVNRKTLCMHPTVSSVLHALCSVEMSLYIRPGVWSSFAWLNFERQVGYYILVVCDLWRSGLPWLCVKRTWFE